nr:ATP synthase F0 subunit 8 [Priolepis eugenius]
MPQLNPHPWFLILTLSYFVFFAVILPIIMLRKHSNEPSSADAFLDHMETWIWPWD